MSNDYSIKHWRTGTGKSQHEIAEEIGITQETLSKYERGVSRIPLPRCPAIEKLTGIPREKLRPDIDWGRGC